jgi:hypothetical protein
MTLLTTDNWETIKIYRFKVLHSTRSTEYPLSIHFKNNKFVKVDSLFFKENPKDRYFFKVMGELAEKITEIESTFKCK